MKPNTRFLSTIILLLLFHSGINYADTGIYASKEKNFLNDKQVKLLDSQLDKSVPACRFIHQKTFTDSINGDIVFECIERWQAWFWSSNNYRILKIPDERINQFHVLDDYLGNRLIPYILGLPKTDQAKFLRKVALFHADNLTFIQTLMNHGVSVKEILLQNISEGGAYWASCDSYMIFLGKNITFYQDNKALYEPILEASLIYEPVQNKSEIRPLYRWEDIHHLTDPTYNICPRVIDRLTQANPALLNKRQSYGGATPLYLYLSGTFMKSPHDIQLASKLITSVNINMKSNNGNTPLHAFLINTNPTNLSNKKKMIQIMIARGANINIKNNEGVTVKDLMLKNPDLSGLLSKSKN